MDEKRTILFVDDEEHILYSLRRLFRREGYEILIARSGIEGLEMLKEHEVSLIVSDQRMPGMIGTEFLAKSREIRPESTRIMLTGHSDLEAATQAINEGGISRYISKPWDDDNLKITVRDIFERIDLETENLKLAKELQEKNKELEAFNIQLEKMVRQRTLELQYKIKELEGKDRITQHMLSVNLIEETLELVLAVISDIIDMDKAIVYLMDGNSPKAMAAIGIFNPKEIVPKADLEKLELSPAHQTAFDRVKAEKKPANVKKPAGQSIPPFAVVPILRIDEFLGYIEVANPKSQEPVSQEDLQVVASFALQAAMAISDAQAHGNLDLWKTELEEVLKDVTPRGNSDL